MKLLINGLLLVLSALLTGCGGGGGETVPPDPILAVPPNTLVGCPVTHPPLLQIPKDIVIESGGLTGLITEHGAGEAGRLTRVNLQTGALLTLVCGFLAPEGFAVTPDGATAWVLESFTGLDIQQNNRLFKVDLPAVTAVMFADKFFHTEGIALEAGALSAVIVTYTQAGVISRIDLTTPQTVPPTTPTTTTTTTTNGNIGITQQGVTPLIKGLSYPEGIAVSALNGRYAWVTQGSTNLVSKIDLVEGKVIISFRGIDIPQRIVLEAGEETALVTGGDLGALFRLNLSNGAVTTLVSGLNHPQGLALEVNGSIAWVIEECAGLTRIDLSANPPSRTILVAVDGCVPD